MHTHTHTHTHTHPYTHTKYYYRGDNADDGMYIVAEGKVGVFAGGKGDVRKGALREYKQGDSIGELELVCGMKR